MRNLFGQDIPATDPGTATDTPTARKKEAKQPDPNGLRKVGCNRTKGAYFARRVKSELNLEETLPWHFEHGAAYHCFHSATWTRSPTCGQSSSSNRWNTV